MGNAPSGFLTRWPLRTHWKLSQHLIPDIRLIHPFPGNNHLLFLGPDTDGTLPSYKIG